MSALDTEVLITGWGHTRFGKLEDDLETLVVSVARDAIAHAGIDAADVDAISLGQFNAGMVPLAFASSLALEASDALLGVPATRVENACASGSAAVQQGITALLAGRARTVLVIGAEKMTHASTSVVGAGLLGADYELAGQESTTGFAGLFADVALEYEKRYRPVGDVLGSIAAKSHANALRNPFAHLRKDLDEAFCRTVSERNPVVSGPLRRTDCSPVSDGAAAVVLSVEPSGGAATAPVRITGFGHANDFLPSAKRDPLAFMGTELAWNRALSMAGITPADLSFLEVHDCFTIAELNLYETLGLTPRGGGHRAIEDGTVFPDGCLPVNVSGGLKSKGHPVGATGVSQHIMAAMQLTGTAGDMQLPSPSRAAVHNMGGLAVANYVSVLETV
ncbi:acetyl-CoA acetyltransferase [Aeromicrobium sp.]|uniref:acetyl-CoA acetyltransferase n=1 Tax=Aeromicrobium sp. TaxID=1871063 RepID=UPI00198605BE|nr:acetyl-CoA acetyltransferase [Aeromicrobium sp.]MBC7631305.1 acetyl-CoA acetyltransferase [Aeromicrobium sp.]